MNARDHGEPSGKAARSARAKAPVDPDERMVATFLEMVRIDSPSGEEAAMAEYVSAVLRELGMTVHVDDAAQSTDSNTGNVIAELPATAAGKTVVLSAHLDTVEPGRGIEPVIEDGIVRSAGNTILGGDDKGGVAAIIEALRRLVASGRPHPCIRVLLTVGEELGLQGAKALSQRDLAGDLCLVLDADGAPGGVVTTAPTHFTFTATFHGHAAHAGVEPEKGRSAIVMAANAITSMRLGRIDEHTTANVGHITGGGRTNVVAASCHITGECRSSLPGRAEEVRAEMDAALKAAASGSGGSVSVMWTKEYDGFTFDENDPVLVLVEDAMRDVGLSPRRFATGGGSDGNVLASKGLPSLVLASGLRNVHGTSETLSIGDLRSLVSLLLAVVDRATG